MAGVKRKRTELNAGAKREICEYKRQKPSQSIQAVRDWAQAKLGLSLARSTVASILQDSHKWLNIGIAASTIVRQCQAQFEELESALILWFGNVRANGAIVSDEMLQEKARCLGSILGKYLSAHSSCWVLVCLVYEMIVSVNSAAVY